ncbi:hypothetical protein BDN72DRAFT_93745 [Pluteus cervinus]|uniref:Uncharacterized protein n=1 Tax=Pluteus cervinus TaxID=181527 RepID=A0ACD3AP44_9AGAR|nr:hypothetical protein BDN72DRAFT_93745 [Pluteus cervinus]
METCVPRRLYMVLGADMRRDSLQQPSNGGKMGLRREASIGLRCVYRFRLYLVTLVELLSKQGSPAFSQPPPSSPAAVVFVPTTIIALPTAVADLSPRTALQPGLFVVRFETLNNHPHPPCPEAARVERIQEGGRRVLFRSGSC